MFSAASPTIRSNDSVNCCPINGLRRSGNPVPIHLNIRQSHPYPPEGFTGCIRFTGEDSGPCGDILAPLILRFALLLAVATCAAGADFVGSKACAACHPAIYRSFMRTPMANASGRVGTGEMLERFERTEFRDSKGAFAYRV